MNPNPDVLGFLIVYYVPRLLIKQCSTVLYSLI